MLILYGGIRACDVWGAVSNDGLIQYKGRIYVVETFGDGYIAYEYRELQDLNETICVSDSLDDIADAINEYACRRK